MRIYSVNTDEKLQKLLDDLVANKNFKEVDIDYMRDCWKCNKESTCVRVDYDAHDIKYADLDFYKSNYPNIIIEEYPVHTPDYVVTPVKNGYIITSEEFERVTQTISSVCHKLKVDEKLSIDVDDHSVKVTNENNKSVEVAQSTFDLQSALTQAIEQLTKKIKLTNVEKQFLRMAQKVGGIYVYTDGTLCKIYSENTSIGWLLNTDVRETGMFKEVPEFEYLKIEDLLNA